MFVMMFKVWNDKVVSIKFFVVFLVFVEFIVFLIEGLY